jgi:peptidoglycan/xylan/chitin deacetylase (PgdA/CDA1 family)
MNSFISYMALSLVFLSFAVYSNIISYTTASAYEILEGIPFTTPYNYNKLPDSDPLFFDHFNKPYQHNKLSDSDPLVFDQIPLTRDEEQKQPGDNNYDNKYVILMFDRGYDTIFSTAKPILDKFGFKASIFIACDYIETEDGMNWNQIRELYEDGHDIQSHGLKHQRLTEVKSDSEIEHIVSGGQECLQEQGFNPTIFQAPFNKGGDDPQILDTINKYFDLAFTGHSELMFLNCDGWENFGYDRENYDGTTDCSPYFSDGTPTPTNKLGMKEWSHDREHYDVIKEMEDYDSHGKEVSSILFEKFAEVVNSQTEFNKQGEINAIPIIGYHEISTDDEIDTSPDLFELEMEYLYDNGFKVITLDDLRYDENQERFYIKNGDNIGGVVLSQFDNKAQKR